MLFRSHIFGENLLEKDSLDLDFRELTGIEPTHESVMAAVMTTAEPNASVLF